MFLKYRRTPNKLTIFFCWIIKLLIRQVSTNLNTKYFTIYCNRNLLKEWVRMHAETCWHLHNQLFIQQNPFTQHSAKIVHRYVYERVDACAISSSEVIFKGMRLHLMFTRLSNHKQQMLRMRFIVQVCLHIWGICYIDRSSTVQQDKTQIIKEEYTNRQCTKK